MPVAQYSLVKAEEYNAVANVVNKIFGDNYSSVALSEISDPARRATHHFGWGAVNIDDNIPVGTIINADKLQYLVDRVNIMIDRTENSDFNIVFVVPEGRTDVLHHTPIRAEDLNLIEEKLNDTILANGTHLTISSDSNDAGDPYAESIVATTATPYKRIATWYNQLVGEHKWSWASYNDARYFFNSGGQLRLSMEMTNGCTSGYYNWADIINEIGVLSFTHDNLFQSSSEYTSGTSEGKGFYDLTDDWQLVFTSSGVTISQYGYGFQDPNYDFTAYGYGYGYGWHHFVSAYSAYTTPLASAYRNPYCMTGYGYGYGYRSVYATSEYSNSYSAYQNLKLRIYAKHANNGSEVHFKIYLDDWSVGQVIDGTIEATLSYLMPTAVSEVRPCGTTTTFDVSPAPTAEITNNFNTSDDS